MISLLLTLYARIIASVICLGVIVKGDYLVNLNLQVQGRNNTHCIGGSVGLTETPIALYYRKQVPGAQLVEGWIFLAVVPAEDFHKNLTLNSNTDGVQFKLVQLEHGGGNCNCWQVNSLNVTATNTDNGGVAIMADSCVSPALVQSKKNCIDVIASNARKYISQLFLFRERRDEEDQCLDDGSNDVAYCYTPQECSVITPRIQVSYTLILNVNNEGEEGCDGVDGIDEGIEFSIRNNTKSGSWRPLQWSYRGTNTGRSNINVRGCAVPLSVTSSRVERKMTICGNILHTNNIQFRWIGSARLENGLSYDDVWALTNVSITLILENNSIITLMDEEFGCHSSGLCKLNSSSWIDSRNGDLSCNRCVMSEPCVNHYLTFGADNYLFQTVNTSLSRVALSQIFNMKKSSGPNSVAIDIDMEEMMILKKIKQSGELLAIFDTEPMEAVKTLEVFSADGRADAGIALYLLVDILNRFNSSDALTRENFSQVFVTVGNNILLQNTIAAEGGNIAVCGSSLLSVMEQLALEVYPDVGNITLGNIVLQAQQILSEREVLDTVNSKHFYTDNNFPEMVLTIPPLETFKMGSGIEDDSGMRVVSFLYNEEVKDLFPGGKRGDNNSELASGIVSTTLQCGDKSCPTHNLNLSTPVTITINHSERIKEILMSNDSFATTCIFWEFLKGINPPKLGINVLGNGEWSDRGCTKNKSLSNTNVTVCECNHLTHFAILMSAAPATFARPHVISLRVIGYVGVSISLVAMALTIVILLGLRSLFNIRNFVHINLCVSLGIAQIIFVAGVSRSDPDNIFGHCQAIAVLLHFFFLVSFMWMLMEGVVLYVVLVKVFVLHPKRYMIGFFVISYGIPLLYLGLLTVPLGFLLPTQPNYGYNSACFLNPETKFIWAFTVPVLVILLMNIGLFIMATIIIMRHSHKKIKEGDKKINVKMVKGWLKAALSLMIIMGLTWVLGLLLVKVKQLITLAYIYTILVAFQGFFIFLIAIVFSIQVREEYRKWWTRKVKQSDILTKYFSGTIRLTSAEMSNRSATISRSMKLSTRFTLTRERDIVSSTKTTDTDSKDGEDENSALQKV